MIEFAAGTEAAAPSQHPAIDTLAEYAAGLMRPGFDLVVAAHVGGCARCGREVAELEALGGGLLATIEPLRLADGALAATLARLDEAVPLGEARPARRLDQLLANARRRWIAPGIWIARIDTSHERDDRVFLLHMRAGGVPDHYHSGTEITQVLMGALSDNGMTYHAGDFVEPDDGGLHSPRVHGDQPCICLFATQGRLKAANWRGRLAFAWGGV